MTRTRRWLAVAVVAAIALAPAAPAVAGRGFHARVTRIPPDVRERMTGVSWHKGCPVPIRDLRLLRISFHGFDGDRHVGKLVAHRDAADALVTVFGNMWRHDFKIRRMHLVDKYGADDQRSMRADNTSAFNCRTVAGTNRWSEHAYGRAIDINPVENPYVGSDGSVSPQKGEEYVDRSQHRKGMIHAGDTTVRAFQRQGWGWGGYWSSSKDYQHFSASGS